MIPQAEVDGVMATDEVRFRRDGTIQKTAYPVRVPNEIPGLLVWLVPNDRAGAPVELAGPNAGRPINFDSWPLVNRTGRGEAKGTATLAPGWGGQCADMSIAVEPRRYLSCEIGQNRFSAGWTFLMLWWPYVEELTRNFYQIQMSYRLNPDEAAGAGFSPAILTGNFTGEGTGFMAYAFDVAGRPTSQLNIEWGSGAGWYMVGADGQSGQNFKCRVNGINSPPVTLGALNTQDNREIVWGASGVGLLLEGCVYDRRLSDEEYSVIEDYWRIKYNNIALGAISLGRAPSESELLTAFRRNA